LEEGMKGQVVMSASPDENLSFWKIGGIV